MRSRVLASNDTLQEHSAAKPRVKTRSYTRCNQSKQISRYEKRGCVGAVLAHRRVQRRNSFTFGKRRLLFVAAKELARLFKEGREPCSTVTNLL